MTNREMFLLATSILFASTTAGLVLQRTMHHPHGMMRPGFEHRGPEGVGPRADAQGKDQRPHPDFFAETDTNKDGFVTKEEMTAKQQARLDDMFATVDTDHDGKLSKEEMDKGRELMRAKWKAKMDAERTSPTAPAPAPVAQ